MILADVRQFKQHALHWAAQHPTCCYLDSNGNTVYGTPQYDLLIAVGAKEVLHCQAGNAFQQLQAFYDTQPDWLFGFFAYDLKNEVEQLHSRHPDYIRFPDLLFFRPEAVIAVTGNELKVIGADTETLYQQIMGTPIPTAQPNQPVELKARFSKGEYIDTVQKIRQHIAEGDVYEMNLCQEFYADGVNIDPVQVFQALNERNKAPFSAFFKHQQRYLLCSSPERFLCKQGQQLTSQPIKGTIRRGSTQAEDQQLQQQLLHDPKERAENVMIVDLVRNDLSRVCIPGTVQVSELFGVKQFEQVHHLVSTIKGTLPPNVPFTKAIANAFPMGSMTGAPKVMAMELIEQYERTRRGLYSGALGYITPNGDFDLNVVIRSIQYNQAEQYLSYQVGGAITYDSIPEKEYEECLLKAEAMRGVLGGL